MSPSVVLALDPGCDESGLVVMRGIMIVETLFKPNEEIAQWLFDRGAALTAAGRSSSELLLIEQVESFGQSVGKEVFDTVFWSGRFAEAWGGTFRRMGRTAVKVALCHTRRATDSNVRHALIDLYGPTKALAVGTKARAGPLFGIKAHLWSCIALGVAFQQQKREQQQQKESRAHV